MPARKRYRKRQGNTVLAVRLGLDFDGFSYRKWGDLQRCKQGDWLVDNGGDIYTVDSVTFSQTYRQVSPGVYEKFGPVWASQASRPGQIQTKEGATHYEAGDYLVSNDTEGNDGYAVSRESFESMYEPA